MYKLAAVFKLLNILSANMASTLVWTLLLCAAALTAAAPKDNRIVGGEPTIIERYPFIVAVEFLGTWTGTWAQSCAANIITSSHVISAAHCFEGLSYSNSYRRIRAGSTYRNTGGVISNVEQRTNHPGYGVGSSYDADITVIRLVTAMVWGPTVQQGSIPAAGTIISGNLPVVHAGWGTLYSGGPLSNDLRHASLYTVDRNECAQRYGGNMITENMICAGILDVGGVDACQGDSGGPLYYGYIIVGIVSWGYGCADSYYPGVSTNVASFTDWIVQTAV